MLNKRQCKLCRQTARVELETEIGWDVFHIFRELDIVHIDIERSLMRITKRFTLAGEFDRGAVNLQRKRGLGIDVNVEREIGKKGNADVQIPHSVLHLFWPVIDINTPAFESDVIDRESERF